MKDFAPFKDMQYKWSEGRGDEFPRLQVRVRDEIVTFGVPEEIVVDETGIVGGGIHLSPAEVNELVAFLRLKQLPSLSKCSRVVRTTTSKTNPLSPIAPAEFAARSCRSS